ncbi:FAD-dependent oxidoreductase [Marinomonas mediterranea]|uniref:NAD(P)/FAD-dependent oxidoreductase n=1 Tax=Marinomonas mediterranea TaxID=119864 RepID=UPI00234B4F23|nr:FAD-binding oxidoreductase [Marinomonas mediterranea]WCN13012.1 FAD-dependent oxidoreductase [Marinomonas mediterranea]
MTSRNISTYSNLPYWLADATFGQTINTTPRYALPTKADAVIVGGGFTGMSAAITLARAGLSVILLEGGRLGEGASSRNGGLLGPSFSKLGVDGLEKTYGRDKVHSTIKESLHAFQWLVDFIKEEEIDCDLSLCGRFRGASHPNHYAGLVEQAEALLKVVDFPAIEVSKQNQHQEVGSDAYYGGMIYPKDGTLQPAKLLSGLSQIAQREGVFLAEHSMVRHVQKAGSRFTVKFDGGEINAAHVLIATNGYTGSAFRPLKRRLIPIRSAMVATEELPESVVREISPNLRGHGGTERLVAYYRPSPDGKRILFGGRAFGSGDQPQLYSRYLHDFMTRIFPQLSHVKLDYAWSGMIAYTFDHVPHIGQLDSMNYAMGYCGSGVGRANYFGYKAAQQILNLEEGKTSFDELPFKGRPLYYGKPWFLPAIMKWHDFADRRGW